MDVGRGAFLFAVWVLLWDNFSVANVLSGLLVVTVVLTVFPTQRNRDAPFVFRPIAAARLAWFVFSQAVQANVFIVRSVVRPGRYVHAGMVTVPLHSPSDGVLSFVANIIALTPGTATIEVLSSPPGLVLHVLDVSDPAEVARGVYELEELTVRAFGGADLIEGLAEPLPPPTAELDVPVEVRK